MASPSVAEMEYDVNFILGVKMLEEDDWAPVEDQSEFAVSSTFGGVDWPVHIALDLVASADDNEDFGFKIEGSTLELDVGARKIWGKKTRPFIGGGLALINGEFEAFTLSDDDDALGAWLDAGVFWRLGRRFNIGIEARISWAEITLFGMDGEAGGEHIGLILGFGKPK